MKIDIISDIHLDFYIKSKEDIDKFVDKIFLNYTDFDVLVIAGDIGHYNDDNAYLVELLSKYYKKIFIVYGNHDLYLLNKSAQKKYQYNSFNRLLEFKEMIKDINNVVFLDGQKEEYQGKVFWGSGLWYEVNSLKHWADSMNDAKYIYDKKGGYKIVIPYDIYSIRHYFNPFALYKNEYEKIQNLDEADIIISHISPIDFKLYDGITNDYYYLPYGKEIIEKINSKLWICGHIHIKQTTKYKDCQIIANPLGYPDENPKFEIKRIEV